MDGSAPVDGDEDEKKQDRHDWMDGPHRKDPSCVAGSPGRETGVVALAVQGGGWCRQAGRRGSLGGDKENQKNCNDPFSSGAVI
jgi:hypothetical protein